jgi:hypothetical protein
MLLQRLQHEQLVRGLQRELLMLQQRFKDSVDRASKMRQHAEK